MICKLLNDKPQEGTVDLSRFDQLHWEGKKIIIGWTEHALQQTTYSEEQAFESFIFGWIAFNGWASCVTEKEHERNYLDTLYLDKEMNSKFETILRDDFLESAHHFRKFWPIFKSKDLREIVDSIGTREQIVGRYRTVRPEAKYTPACAFNEDHLSGIPLDWPHTLASIYQVRCNLFHGYKGVHCENDRQLVSSALKVLKGILKMCIPKLSSNAFGNAL